MQRVERQAQLVQLLLFSVGLVMASTPADLPVALPWDEDLMMKGAGFDFYVLATFWPAELCHSEHTESCAHPNPWWVEHLTGHGLWPNNEDGTYPQSCGGDSFNHTITDVEIGLSTMQDYWPNMSYDPVNKHYDNLWAHEWSKHGTCTGMTQSQYFNTALKLFKTVTPPSLSSATGSSLALTEVQESFGGEEWVVLQCSGGKYLQQAWLCFSKDETQHTPSQRIPCPPAVLRESNCEGPSVVIPSLLRQQSPAAEE